MSAAIGDAVYGFADWYRDGAAADYVAVEARNLARKPAMLSRLDRFGAFACLPLPAARASAIAARSIARDRL